MIDAFWPSPVGISLDFLSNSTHKPGTIDGRKEHWIEHEQKHETRGIDRMIARKKLIEVALPLDAINKASAREKSIRHGHPSTLHLWWARRPLAAARAVIFAQMVDDPSALPDLFPTEKAQEKERKRLFKIIEDLVLWENTSNEEVLERAREEIRQSWRRTCADNADHPEAEKIQGAPETGFSPDGKGWFKIAVDRELEEVAAIHYPPGEEEPDVVVKGRDSRAIYQTIIREGLISTLDHAAYLGKELEKAHIALVLGRSYVQERPLFSGLSRL